MLDEEEQRILEHIQGTYPAEFVEKGMQVLKDIVLRRTRSQIELDVRLDRMQAEEREVVVLDRWERIIKGKCLAEALHPINNPAWGTSSSSGGPPPTAQVVSPAATTGEDEEVLPAAKAGEDARQADDQKASQWSSG